MEAEQLLVLSFSESCAAVPPLQPGSSSVCYQESRGSFLPVWFELSMPSPIHILTLQLCKLAADCPCCDLYLQIQKANDYKPAV